MAKFEIPQDAPKELLQLAVSYGADSGHLQAIAMDKGIDAGRPSFESYVLKGFGLKAGQEAKLPADVQAALKDQNLVNRVLDAADASPQAVKAHLALQPAGSSRLPVAKIPHDLLEHMKDNIKTTGAYQPQDMGKSMAAAKAAGFGSVGEMVQHVREMPALATTQHDVHLKVGNVRPVAEAFHNHHKAAVPIVPKTAPHARMHGKAGLVVMAFTAVAALAGTMLGGALSHDDTKPAPTAQKPAPAKPAAPSAP